MQDVNIAKWGEKMLCNSISRNKIPAQFLSISKNARIVDKCITKRPWTKTRKYWSTISGEIQGITYNNGLQLVMWGKFYKVDTTTRVETEVGSVGTTEKVNMLVYGKYTIILTGIGYPYYYDGTTLAQATSTICPDVNPIIAEKYQWFTFITGNTTATQNILYISRPITPDNPERCVDWVGTNSEKITYWSKILGLVSSMNRLIIFTETQIEYIDKSSLQTIGDVATLLSTPIGDWWELASCSSLLAWGDTVMYLTKNNTINTLFYAEWTVDPIIWDITDDDSFTITQYLQTLAADQSNSFGYFDDNKKEFVWFLREINVPYNNTCLVYDLGNKTWNIDTKKFYNDVIVTQNKVYAGSAINCTIIEVNTGLDDDSSPVGFEIQDTDIMLWTLREKIFGGRQTSWGTNRQSNIKINTLVDDRIVSTNTIKGEDYYTTDEVNSFAGLGDTQIGWDAIGGLREWVLDTYKRFDKTVDHWYIWKRGTRIKRNITESSLWSDFYLDYFTLFAETTGNITLSDKF